MQYLSPAQCRAARGLLDWSQPDLAKKCDMHVQTICAFEQQTSTPTKTTLEKITKAFEDFGVEFTRDGGVNPHGMKFKHLRGTDGLRTLVDDTYEQARLTGGPMQLWNAKPDNYIKWLGQNWFNKHSERMAKLSNGFKHRITTQVGEYNFISNHFAEYRWIPKKIFNEQSIYCYSNRIAFVNFEEKELNIYIIYNWDFADSFRVFFNLIWDDIATIPDSKDHKPKKRKNK